MIKQFIDTPLATGGLMFLISHSSLAVQFKAKVSSSVPTGQHINGILPLSTPTISNVILPGSG